MVISSRSYGHLKIPYDPQQLNDDRSTLFSEDESCRFFKNDCGVKNLIAIKYIYSILYLPGKNERNTMQLHIYKSRGRAQNGSFLFNFAIFDRVNSFKSLKRWYQLVWRALTSKMALKIDKYSVLRI